MAEVVDSINVKCYNYHGGDVCVDVDVDAFAAVASAPGVAEGDCK